MGNKFLLKTFLIVSDFLGETVRSSFGFRTFYPKKERDLATLTLGF